MLLPGKFALAMQKAAIRMLPAGRLTEAGVSKQALIDALDAMANADYATQLEAITAPALVICSANDAAGLPFAEALAAGLPNGELVKLPGASPQPMIDAPEAYNKALLDFLG
jgi:pimeloyl-ACP methyl ester carboxylesterase